ncbi:hypothetical protein BH10PSE13_BH10PSE13_22670 [soil metagenome]
MIGSLLPALVMVAAPAQNAEAVVAPAAAETQPPQARQAAGEQDPPELRDALDDPASTTVVGAEPPPVPKHARGDSLEGFNRTMFGVHQRLDKAIYRPVAMGYKTVVPKPVRSGLRNMLSNLTEPIVFLNYLLQLKPGKAVKTFARFTINSTVGLAGLIDVAKAKDVALPHVPNGFGNTLARYGVGPGPYLFLPFAGPTTLRDVMGGPIDGAVLPVSVGVPFNRVEFQVSTAVLGGLNRRVEADAELRALFDGAVDPYATLRSVFLQNRAAEVEEIRHPTHSPGTGVELTDPLSDPGAGAAAPSPVANTPELQDPLADPATP